MVKPIFTSIMIDLSIYINSKYPGESFAIMMDNASMHSLIKQLPYDNLVFVKLPPNCTVSGMKIVKYFFIFHYEMDLFVIPG